MKKNLFKTTGLAYWWVAALILVVDLASKLWVMNQLPLHKPHPVLPFFFITYERNFGAAFSLFYGHRWPLAVIAVIIIGLLAVFLAKTKRQDKLTNIAYTLILGGAVGNVFDRLYHGFVVDFLDVYLGSWRYPTFNIADSAICIGAACLI